MRFLPFVPYALAAALCGALWLQSARVKALRLDNDRKEAVIAKTIEAQRIHKIYVEQTEAVRRENQTLRDDLRTLEGRDAPLSDHMRAVSKRLWAR